MFTVWKRNNISSEWEFVPPKPVGVTSIDYWKPLWSIDRNREIRKICLQISIIFGKSSVSAENACKVVSNWGTNLVRLSPIS